MRSLSFLTSLCEWVVGCGFSIRRGACWISDLKVQFGPRGGLVVWKRGDPLLRSVLQMGQRCDMLGHLLIQSMCVCGGRCHQFSFLCCTSSGSEVFANNVLELLGVMGSPANIFNTVGVSFCWVHAILALLAPWLVRID
jgi:hypothetical protein